MYIYIYIYTCTGTCIGDTRSLFRTRGFDQAPRATGIVLMKPFPPPSFPSLLAAIFHAFLLRRSPFSSSIPQLSSASLRGGLVTTIHDAPAKENGRLMEQIMELPRRGDRHVRRKRRLASSI